MTATQLGWDVQEDILLDNEVHTTVYTSEEFPKRAHRRVWNRGPMGTFWKLPHPYHSIVVVWIISLCNVISH